MLRSGTLDSRRVVDFKSTTLIASERGQQNLDTSGMAPRFFQEGADAIVRPKKMPSIGILIVYEVADEDGSMQAWTTFSAYRTALEEIRDREVRGGEAGKVFEEYIQLLRQALRGSLDFFQEIDLGFLKSHRKMCTNPEAALLLRFTEKELVRLFDLRIACVDTGISSDYTLNGAIELARMPVGLLTPAH